ncbi:MAG: pirin family protein [Planctomycetota bacterium]
MIHKRPAKARGHFDHGWLDTFHTFSFGEYFDAEHSGFRSLRVMNEDRVAPGQGFGMHGHRDMEIVTLVLSGALEHRDSLGNGEVLRPGELQRMTAGTGIRHSEFNPSETEPVHLYQIWITPEQRGLTPSYEQRAFDTSSSEGSWQLIASHDGRDGSLTVYQDVSLWRAQLDAGQELTFELSPQRFGWLQVMTGQVELNELTLAVGDGAAISDETKLLIRASESSEVLLFDLN